MSKLQNEDFKTEAELITDGGSAANLLNDVKIYVSANSINKTLDQAIIDGDIGGGGSGANTSLSNLTSPTAINQNLSFSVSGPFGPGGDINNVKSLNAGISNNLVLNSDSQIRLQGVTAVALEATGVSGEVVIAAGAALSKFRVNTTQARLENDAKLTFVNPSTLAELSVGIANTATTYALTLPDSQGAANTYLKNDGSGNLTWASVSGGGGANTTLSNLTSPTAINQDLTFASGNFISSPVGLGFTIDASTLGTSFNVFSDEAATITSSLSDIVLNASAGVLDVNTAMGVTLNDKPISGISSLELNGSTSGTLTVQPAATTTSYTVTLPATQGASNTFLKNNGSGVLTWEAAGGGVSDINISALNVDWSLGDTFYKDISTSSTFTFSNLANGKTIIVILKNTGASDITVTFPTSLKSGILYNIISPNKENIYTFIRSNNKTYASVVSDFE